MNQERSNFATPEVPGTLWDVNAGCKRKDDQDLFAADRNDLGVHNIPAVHLLGDHRVGICQIDSHGLRVTRVCGNQSGCRLAERDEAIFRGHRTPYRVTARTLYLRL